MTDLERLEITKISKEFASGFKPNIPSINKSGWLIVDPLSAFLNSIGFENTLQRIDATEKVPMVLIMTFKDGSKFIPAGKDLQPLEKGFKNWMWV